MHAAVRDRAPAGGRGLSSSWFPQSLAIVPVGIVVSPIGLIVTALILPLGFYPRCVILYRSLLPLVIMLEIKEAFVNWVHAVCQEGERLLSEDLAESPRHYFTKNSSVHAVEFFERVERWRSWVSGVITGLYRRARHVDHLVAELQRGCDDAHLLIFRITDYKNPRATKTFDLRVTQATFTSGNGWQELRQWFERGMEDPLWTGVLDALRRSIRAFRSKLLEQADELLLVSIETPETLAEPTLVTQGSFPTRYECIERLGEGVYGDAWRARDTELRRPVVVKFIRSIGASRKDVVDHAHALARVSDPSIVAVYDVASVLDPVTNAALDAVIMELVEGPSLVERLGHPVDRAEALRIGSAILDAVAAYHTQGLVHLDLHDGNVIVGNHFVKVIDPMPFETVALKSSRVRETQQQRELRRARDLLGDLLRACHVPVEEIASFEQAARSLELAPLRSSFEMVVQKRVIVTVGPDPLTRHTFLYPAATGELNARRSKGMQIVGDPEPSERLIVLAPHGAPNDGLGLALEQIIDIVSICDGDPDLDYSQFRGEQRNVSEGVIRTNEGNRFGFARDGSIALRRRLYYDRPGSGRVVQRGDIGLYSSLQQLFVMIRYARKITQLADKHIYQWSFRHELHGVGTRHLMDDFWGTHGEDHVWPTSAVCADETIALAGEIDLRLDDEELGNLLDQAGIRIAASFDKHKPVARMNPGRAVVAAKVLPR